ncbi:GGDEF domain-containing protein [Solwaraspora sp. WMMB762]|uniref:GGDEF domain-containing protein n=1 Tax=Solwaraspora sp. WMMB762 TaxID=3404120 RepID=UPI003B950C66
MTPARALTTAAALGVAATCGYLTARHTLRAELDAIRHTAHHDPLTGAYNRAGLAATADDLIHTAHTARRPIVVALVDLVGFKAVNDTHGHDAGDHILTVVASRLHGIAGPAGITARLGGDEFAILTTGPAARLGDADTWLSGWLPRTHHRLTTATVHGQQSLAVGATLGATLAHPGQPASVWLHRADLAMYAARARQSTTAVYDGPADDTSTPVDRPTDRTRDRARPTRRLSRVWGLAG